MRVLAIDDDASVLRAIERILVAADHEVRTIACAKEAAEHVTDEHYDLILVDYKMPERDGIWFLRNASVPNGTKVLLVTAYANRDIINEMFRLGISGYVIKPFDGPELLRHVDYHCQ